MFRKKTELQDEDKTVLLRVLYGSTGYFSGVLLNVCEYYKLSDFEVILI